MRQWTWDGAQGIGLRGNVLYNAVGASSLNRRWMREDGRHLTAPATSVALV